MTPPEDRNTAAPEARNGGDVSSTGARLQGSSLGRPPRRRNEQQLFGVALICAVLFFGVGLVVARLVWKPKAPAATGATVQTNATGTQPGAGQVPGVQPTMAPPAGGQVPGGQPTTPQPGVTDKPAFNIQTRPHIPTNDRQNFIDTMTKLRQEDPKYLGLKWERYQRALELGDLKVDRVKEAFLAAPREKFCRPWNLDEAYKSDYLDIHYGVTISGPHIVCRMTNALNPQPYHKCLEIGTGSGYQASMLAELSNRVYSIEIIAPLLQETQQIYDKLVQEGWEEYKNVHLKAADGYYGWKEAAPFDRIIVTCAIDHIPPPLLEQLAPNGIMVIPIGSPGSQRVLKITKTVDPQGEVKLAREDLYPGRTKPIVFVPFTKEGGGTHFRQ